MYVFIVYIYICICLLHVLYLIVKTNNACGQFRPSTPKRSKKSLIQLPTWLNESPRIKLQWFDWKFVCGKRAYMKSWCEGNCLDLICQHDTWSLLVSNFDTSDLMDHNSFAILEVWQTSRDMPYILPWGNWIYRYNRKMGSWAHDTISFIDKIIVASGCKTKHNNMSMLTASKSASNQTAGLNLWLKHLQACRSRYLAPRY